jgi:hypothetical protein
VIAVPLLMALFGLVIALGFGLDIAHLASGLARAHSGYARRFPRYYALSDPWRLSSKPGYWRWLGVAFGAIFVILGTVALIAASAPPDGLGALRRERARRERMRMYVSRSLE